MLSQQQKPRKTDNQPNNLPNPALHLVIVRVPNDSVRTLSPWHACCMLQMLHNDHHHLRHLHYTARKICSVEETSESDDDDGDDDDDDDRHCG